MRSLHTNQSVAAAELLTRGTFEFACVSDEGRVFHHERSADDASGVGPVGSWRVAELADETALHTSGL